MLIVICFGFFYDINMLNIASNILGLIWCENLARTMIIFCSEHIRMIVSRIGIIMQYHNLGFHILVNGRVQDMFDLSLIRIEPLICDR